MLSSRGLLAPFLLASGALFACTTVIHEAPKPTDPVPPVEDASETPAPVLDAGPDVEAPPPFKISFPQVLSRGGPVIASGKVVPIVFKGDDWSSSIDSFTKKIAGSKYWASTATEYGVGPLTAGKMIEASESAPTDTTSVEIEDWLRAKLSGDAPAFGAPDKNTLYAIYYPASTVISDDGSGLGTSCETYGGYHSSISVGGEDVGYAVMPRCSDIDDLTVSASHEYFEWATDPFANDAAFQKLDDEHWAWQPVMLGELSDMCTYMDRSYIRPEELGFQVQRHWSNKFSLAGTFPCAPVKDIAYVQAVIAATDDTVVPDYFNGDDLTTKAVTVDIGKTRTVDVHVYSDKPVSDDIGLRVMSLEEFQRAPSSTGFKFTLSSSYAAAGSTVTVDISAKKKGYDIAVALAYLSETEVHMWPILVTTPSYFGGKLAQGADLEEMFRHLAGAAANKRVRTSPAGLPKLAADGRIVKWLPGIGRVVLPPPPER